MSTNDESFILQKREDLELTPRTQNADALSRFLDEPATRIAEIVTGALGEGMKGVAMSAGRLVQGALKVQLLTQFAREINYFRERGKIEEDFAKDKYGFQGWVELIAVIDSETPDEDRVKAMKAAFFAINRINSRDGDRIASYQLFRIAKRLTSGQILILKAAYELSKTNAFPRGAMNADTWFQQIANHLGHGLVSLVEHEDKSLTDYYLLNRRSSEVRGSGVDGTNARLTDFGLRLCKMIEEYDEARNDMRV
jgi:hypothetical protein